MMIENQVIPRNQDPDWVRATAYGGDATAQFDFAMMFFYGKGVPKDVQTAAGWCRKSAEQGCAGAQFSLGMMFARGEGLPRDSRMAYFWVLVASSHITGMAHVHEELRSCLTEGECAVVQARARSWSPATK